MKRKLFILFLALWGLLIFFFSSQSYSEQNLTPYLTILLGDSNLDRVFSHIQFTYAGREISVSNLGMVHFIEFLFGKRHTYLFSLCWVLCRSLSVLGYGKTKGQLLLWRLSLFFFMLLQTKFTSIIRMDEALQQRMFYQIHVEGFLES